MDDATGQINLGGNENDDEDNDDDDNDQCQPHGQRQ